MPFPRLTSTAGGDPSSRVSAANLRPTKPRRNLDRDRLTSEAGSLDTEALSEPDVPWVYDQPYRQVDPIAGLIAFYNEKLDIPIDGTTLERPGTHFT